MANLENLVQKKAVFSLGSQAYDYAIKSADVDLRRSMIEMLKNMYDADAEHGFLTLDFTANNGAGQIAFEDDGSGMTFDEVVNSWLTAFGDVKSKELVSPKGRDYLGGQGVASKACFSLGTHVMLETATASGEFTRFSHTIDQKIIAGDFIDDIQTGTTESRRKGTRIVIDNLRFEKRDLNLPRIQAEIPRNIPLRRGFSVYINDKQIIDTRFKNMDAYSFEHKIDGGGIVEGTVYYSPRLPSPENGVWFYHNEGLIGSRVGIPRTPGLMPEMRSKLCIELDATSLADIIRKGRSGYVEEDERYKSVMGALSECILHVQEHAQSFEQVSLDSAYTRKRMPLLTQLGTDVREQNSQLVKKTSELSGRRREQNSVGNVLQKIELSTKIKFKFTAMEGTSRGYYDAATDQVRVNIAYPALQNVSNSREVVAHLEETYVSIMSKHFLSEMNCAPKEETSMLAHLEAHLWSVMRDVGFDETEGSVISPLKLYTNLDISDKLDLGTGVTNYLVDGGYFGKVTDGRVKGKHLHEGIGALKGYMTLYEALEDSKLAVQTQYKAAGLVVPAGNMMSRSTDYCPEMKEFGVSDRRFLLPVDVGVAYGDVLDSYAWISPKATDQKIKQFWDKVMRLSEHE